MQRTVLQLRERVGNLTVLFQCLGKKYQLKKEFKNMSFHGAKFYMRSIIVQMNLKLKVKRDDDTEQIWKLRIERGRRKDANKEKARKTFLPQAPNWRC